MLVLAFSAASTDVPTALLPTLALSVSADILSMLQTQLALAAMLWGASPVHQQTTANLVFLGILFLTARASSHVTTPTALVALVVHHYVLLAQLVSQWSTKLAFLAVTPTAMDVPQVPQSALHAHQTTLS